MIGNDIVDLNYKPGNTSWQRERFKEIIFTAYERSLIASSNTPYIMTWRLWSMKESAFKVCFKDRICRPYIPKQFVCSLKGNYGLVTYNDFKCTTKTVIGSEYLFTEASFNPKKGVSHCFKMKNESYQFQTKQVKSELTKILSKDLQVDEKHFRVEKARSGSPYVLIDDKPLNLHVSLTHHGKWGAISYSA